MEVIKAGRLLSFALFLRFRNMCRRPNALERYKRRYLLQTRWACTNFTDLGQTSGLKNQRYFPFDEAVGNLGLISRRCHKQQPCEQKSQRSREQTERTESVQHKSL